MKINVDITKRLDWLEKRINISYVEREYIELQMKELAREVVKNLTIPVVRLSCFTEVLEAYSKSKDHDFAIWINTQIKKHEV